VAELNGQLADNLWFFSGLQWDTQNSAIDRGNVSIRYRNKLNHIFNVGYRYRREDIFNSFTVLHQTNISFLLPIYDNWSIVGRWQYSILDNLTLESYIGLEKDNCCWRFRILGRRYVNDVDSSPETAIFVQFELKGLSSVGNRVEEFLEENLTGYRENDRY
jgi:LPS-assembly protein